MAIAKALPITAKSMIAIPLWQCLIGNEHVEDRCQSGRDQQRVCPLFTLIVAFEAGLEANLAHHSKLPEAAISFRISNGFRNLRFKSSSDLSSSLRKMRSRFDPKATSLGSGCDSNASGSILVKL
ncbi:MAG: hypothetical protein RL367_1594 [Pseudomonadota bacterium]